MSFSTSTLICHFFDIASVFKFVTDIAEPGILLPLPMIVHAFLFDFRFFFKSLWMPNRL